MPRRPLLSLLPPGRMRLLAAAAAIAVLAALGVLGARLTHGQATPHPVAHPSVSPTIEAVPAPAGPVSRGSVAAPPVTTDPVVFAKAFTRTLWSYDTRTNSQSQQLDGLRAWVRADPAYTDWDSVAQQVPTAALWQDLAGQQQHATAQITEGHIPSAFTAAVAKDPSQLTAAYVYPVTVTGTVQIAWKGGSGSEQRAITVAVQCRPGTSCTLAAIAPTTSP
ncbi:hypothetical protein [Streptacidiphilus fuscans]|uniref:Uncharacterized protein n=1 Tax=Streptacidiphilus fuscans TaxID=2789292 RepID=A0A931FHF1_9ACTN|nr:hypothetical protein [Streptacidiphilus fuscans]MBF9071766.1 hypothetical protein [Streptacidiphilus fuscans]